MMQTRRRFGFAMKSLHHFVIVGREPRHLQRDFAIEQRVVGSVNGAERPATQNTDDSKAADQFLLCNAIIRGMGGRLGRVRRRNEVHRFGLTWIGVASTAEDHRPR